MAISDEQLNTNSEISLYISSPLEIVIKWLLKVIFFFVDNSICPFPLDLAIDNVFISNESFPYLFDNLILNFSPPIDFNYLP